MEYFFSERINRLKANAIREIFNALQKGDIISFAGGFPALDNLPDKEILDITKKILSSKESKKILQYGSTEGYRPLVEQLMKFVSRYSINNLSAENILVVSGGQQAIDLVSKVMLNKDDCVLLERPTYLAAIQIFNSYEANICDIDSFADSDITYIEQMVARHKPKLIYLVPTFANPTGKTISLERREEIIAIAQKYNVLIVEDNPYEELRYSKDRIASMKSLDTNSNVLFISSFSKIISPGLRLGYAIGDKALIRKMAIAKQGVDVHSSLLSQAIVNEYISSNLIDERIEKLKIEYKEKRDLMLNCIDQHLTSDIWQMSVPDGGLFLWVEFTESSNLDADKLFDKMLLSKVAYVPGSAFYSRNPNKRTLRLNFSNPCKSDIEKGMTIMAKVIKDNL